MSQTKKKKKKKKKKSPTSIAVTAHQKQEAQQNPIDSSALNHAPECDSAVKDDDNKKESSFKRMLPHFMVLLSMLTMLGILFFTLNWICAGISPYAYAKDCYLRHQLRSTNSVQLINGLDDNRALNKIKPGVYGYKWYLSEPYTAENASDKFAKHSSSIKLSSSHNDIEIHYLKNQDIALVGYVTKKTAANLKSNTRMTFWLFSETPYHGEITADTLISVSLKNIKILERSTYTQGLLRAGSFDKYLLSYKIE